MFTPYERRQLRLIEEWFEQDDPALARTLRSGPVRRTSPVPQILAISVAVALAVLGIVTSTFVLIFAAAVAAIVAGCLVTSRRDKTR